MIDDTLNVLIPVGNGTGILRIYRSSRVRSCDSTRVLIVVWILLGRILV